VEQQLEYKSLTQSKGKSKKFDAIVFKFDRVLHKL